MKVTNISLCLVEASYKNFLINLFIECRPELTLISNISEKQTDNIILQQFIMEQQQLIQTYPKAELNIIMYNNESVGRIYVNHGVTTDHIIEIGLLKNFRGLGIGKKIVTEVIEKALAKEKTVSLQVAWFNQGAYAFYEKLGFKITENKGAYYEMKYMP